MTNLFQPSVKPLGAACCVGRNSRPDDYLKPGDLLTLDLDAAKNSLVGIAASTYMKEATDVVTMQTAMGALGDGTVYPAATTLDVKSRNITR